MVVVSSSKYTCPGVCPFKGSGCYAEGGPLAWHWDKINNKKIGTNYNDLLNSLSSLPKNTKVRLWQMGDMPGCNNNIHLGKTRKLVQVCKGLKAFGYTHKPMDRKNNIKAIRECNKNGITINISANSLKHVDKLLKYRLPIVTALPKDIDVKNIRTKKGKKVIVCPAELSDKITCNTCGGSKGPLCYRRNRNYVIGFVAHGNRAKMVSNIAKEK